MKYAKEWSSLISQLPLNLQQASLNYKQWKKRCKSLELNEAIVLLQQECDIVETVFNMGYHDIFHPVSIFQCFSLRKQIPCVNPHTLLLFAQSNAKTMYKVCKRLQKCHADATPMQWLVSLRAAHEFSFLGGHHTAHLQLRQDSPTLECPLCFDQVDNKFMLVYECGHNACIACTLRYAQVHERGAWYHALLYARRRDCPYCHYDKALIYATTV